MIEWSRVRHNKSRVASLRTLGLAVVGITVVAVGTAIALRKKHPPQDTRSALPVPHTTSSVVLDGETNDDAWLAAPGPARTGTFHFSSGEPARPYSEARMIWNEREGIFYLTLYAADEDIRTRTTRPDGPLWIDDAFRVTLARDGNEWIIDVSPKCIVTDGKRRGNVIDYTWQSGARVGCDTDGTINDSSDSDEEWVVEMALPLASIGVPPKRGESFDLSLERCDTPKTTPRVCGFWGEKSHGRIVLD